MKKILLLCTFSFLTISISFSQTGSSFIIANIGVDNYKIVNNEYTKTFKVGGGYGYSITEPMALGAEFSYSTFKIKNALTTSSSTSWSAGPFIRSTFPLSDMISFYSQLGAGYQTEGNKTASGFYAYLNPAAMLKVDKVTYITFTTGLIRYDNIKSFYSRFRFLYGNPTLGVMFKINGK